MSLMNWALEVATAHPELDGALVNSDGPWLDVLLPDGRTFRFRPFEMIDPDAPEERRRELLNRLITIGVSGATTPQVTEGAAGSTQPGAASPHNGAESSASATGTGAPTGSNAPEMPGTPPGRGQKNLSWRDIFAQFFGTMDPSDPGFPHHDPALAELSDEQDDTEGPIMPIVRAADYFTRVNRREDDSFIYLPLTDFVGVGLARDTPDNIIPLYFSDLDLIPGTDDVGPLFGHAVESLRGLNAQSGYAALELAVMLYAGARVLAFTAPNNYQSSWFADVDLVQQVAYSISKQYHGSLPLFVPASRSRLFVVLADDPELPALFNRLRQDYDIDDAIYPLPHTVAADGWMEWIPMPDHPAYAPLANLRATFRGRMYDHQQEFLSRWPEEMGHVALYEVHDLDEGAVSLTQWRRSDHYGSIPAVADFINYLDDADPEAANITIRLDVARDVWPEGFKPLENVWPPRYEVSGFPDPETFRKLSEAAHRAF
ncbi:hypothetical protein [Actinotignum timonense]|uniref:hypothetical protein n=1 Tax=Actinotignum timonense TaxID=1870995 RepID=UPI00254CA2D5|nr:hypothetical protein [Actinotignum timonense]MDK8781683.1 hypothetical protein [Actinotignum timonense]